MSIARAAIAVGILAAGPFQARQDAPRIVEITAERFSFTPSEISLLVGEEVEFRIASEDTAHGFRIAGTPIAASIPKRGKGEIAVRFRPDRAGRYTFECSRMCGAGHHFMRGVLIVRDASEPKGSR
jgi:cytochrome c oxidase subunit 2